MSEIGWINMFFLVGSSNNVSWLLDPTHCCGFAEDVQLIATPHLGELSCRVVAPKFMGFKSPGSKVEKICRG